LTAPDGFSAHSQHVHPQHPPDKQYRYDSSRDVNDPVARCSRLSEIEHAAMVAGPAQVTVGEIPFPLITRASSESNRF